MNAEQLYGKSDVGQLFRSRFHGILLPVILI